MHYPSCPKAVISVAGMRQSDAAEIAGGTDSKLLMYRAGIGIFQSCVWHGKTTILAGSGNNAGDGYVLALLLQEAGYAVEICRCTEKLSTDGAYYLSKCEANNIPIVTEPDWQSDIFVDCLLGTGFQGTLRENLQSIVKQLHQTSAYVVSVDINSGMNGDSGEGICVLSDRTVCIGYLKPGILQALENGTAKSVTVCDIGIALDCEPLEGYTEQVARLEQEGKIQFCSIENVDVIAL